ncbi:MAG: roadblock/LC7 domain-containing protein [Thermoproteota archaeon]
MEVQKAAQRLLELSPSVRVVTICNNEGKPIYSAHSKRVKNLLSRKESKASLQSAARAWKLRRALQRKLGPCKYVLAEYGRVKRIVMPAGKSHLLYVTTSSAYDHNKIIKKVHRFR